jgi:uncharacterized membrane protein YfhO
VNLQANLGQAGYVILLDTAYPGWVAYVDGQATPIITAYYRTRAIYVTAGKHTIEFVYRPWSFYAGVVLALIGVLAIIFRLDFPTKLTIH